MFGNITVFIEINKTWNGTNSRVSVVQEKINELGDRTEELAWNAAQTGEMGNMVERHRFRDSLEKDFQKPREVMVHNLHLCVPAYF